MTARGGERPHGSHLGSLVSAYVDRDLPAGVLLACDQHLGVCGSCRAVAEEERRLMESMRRALAPHPSSSLQSALLGLADHPAPTTCRPHLPVVQPGAPPLHRSPVRAAVLAGLAAGASAAAAVSLGVAGVGPAGPSAPGSGPPASAATVRGPQAPVPPAHRYDADGHRARRGGPADRRRPAPGGVRRSLAQRGAPAVDTITS